MAGKRIPDPFVPDVVWGFAVWVVRAISEDELVAFGAFLAERLELPKADREA